MNNALDFSLSLIARTFGIDVIDLEKRDPAEILVHPYSFLTIPPHLERVVRRARWADRDQTNNFYEWVRTA